MPWVRFDDTYPDHPKIGPLSDRLYRLHNRSVFWCARHTTDGVIRAEQLTQVRANAKPADAAELVRRRLWHTEDEPPCPSPQCPPPGPDGWVVHDYWGYQPKREVVERERASRADRQQRWRERRRGSNASTPHERDGPSNASTEPLRNGSRNGSVDPAPYPPPPRPAPKEAGGGAPRSDPGGSSAPPAASSAGGAAGERDGANAPDPAPPPAPARADPDTVHAKAAQARAAIRRPAPAPSREPGAAIAELLAGAGGEPRPEPDPCPACGVLLDPDGECRNRDCPKETIDA